MLDVSETGAKVRTASVVPIPRQVTLRFRGGAMFPAVRRWTRGMEIGFSFATAATLGEVPADAWPGRCTSSSARRRWRSR